MNERGQSLVELAISLTVLLFVLSGIVEFGIIFFQYVQLRDAAQEAAQYGSFCGNTCDLADIELRARASSDKPVDLMDSNVVFLEFSATDVFGNPKDPELACEGDALTVLVIYVHRIFMPFMPKLIGRDKVVLDATVTNTVLVPVC